MLVQTISYGWAGYLDYGRYKIAAYIFEFAEAILGGFKLIATGASNYEE